MDSIGNFWTIEYILPYTKPSRNGLSIREGYINDLHVCIELN